jgi:hypothetical protein
VTRPASEWIRNFKTRKALEIEWVFAGSRFVPNAEGKEKPPEYLANHGDLICVCNMESAVLDLPVRSPKKFDSRVYEVHSEHVPDSDTKVEVILEPVVPKKTAKKAE